MASRALREANRGTFAPGPPPALGEECPRCHRVSGVLVMAEDADTPLGFLTAGAYIVRYPCLLCWPIPLWEIAARNLAAAYHPHRGED